LLENTAGAFRRTIEAITGAEACAAAAEIEAASGGAMRIFFRWRDRAGIWPVAPHARAIVRQSRPAIGIPEWQTGRSLLTRTF